MRSNLILKHSVCWFIFAFVFVNSLNAQQVDKNSNSTKRLLLIQFNPKLFMCDVAKVLGENSGKTYDEVRDYFRNNLTTSLKAALTRNYIVGIPVTGTNTRGNLESAEMRIYDNISYKYELPTKNLNTAKKIKSSDKKESNGRSNIVKGEIRTKSEDIEGKYLMTFPKDDKFIPTLAKLNGADFILFISQFEFQNDYSAATLGKVTADRILKIHFILYNATGKPIYGDMVVQKVPCTNNNIEEIVKNYYPKAIEIIQNALAGYSK